MSSSLLLLRHIKMNRLGPPCCTHIAERRLSAKRRTRALAVDAVVTLSAVCVVAVFRLLRVSEVLLLLSGMVAQFVALAMACWLLLRRRPARWQAVDASSTAGVVMFIALTFVGCWDWTAGVYSLELRVALCLTLGSFLVSFVLFVAPRCANLVAAVDQQIFGAMSAADRRWTRGCFQHRSRCEPMEDRIRYMTRVRRGARARRRLRRNFTLVKWIAYVRAVMVTPFTEPSAWVDDLTLAITLLMVLASHAAPAPFALLGATPFAVHIVVTALKRRHRDADWHGTVGRPTTSGL